MASKNYVLDEVDSLEAVVIIDNEIDIMSSTSPDTVTNFGRVPNIALSQPSNISNRGDVKKEWPMKSICCGAHGLSILVVRAGVANDQETATRGKLKHSILFDTGPEEDMWERNVKRLGIDLAAVERIQLSHWHRDHSGGMLKSVEMITQSKAASGSAAVPLTVDLHPARPDYRGFNIGEIPVSMEADPTFDEITSLGGRVEKNDKTHTVLDNMFLISGEIPAVTPYEKGLRNAIRFDKQTGQWEKDEDIMDERFLMCNLKGKGIVLFTGCSHRGVINATKHAISLLGDEIPLHAVIGGFHLVGEEQEANVPKAVKDFKALAPDVLLPGHCSGWRAKYEIEKEMPGKLVPCTVGSRFMFAGSS